MNYFNITKQIKITNNHLKQNSKILIICSSKSEIEDVYEELIGFVNKKRIVRMYDREILPYDHFSTPDDVIKNVLMKFKIFMMLV